MMSNQYYQSRRVYLCKLELYVRCMFGIYGNTFDVLCVKVFLFITQSEAHSG